jgi:hypothetical protein
MNKKEVRTCLEDLTSTTTPEASGFVVSPVWFGGSLGFQTRTRSVQKSYFLYTSMAFF